MDDDRGFSLGGLLIGLGGLWLALFFVATTGVFGSGAFADIVLETGALLPVAMLFVGRVVRRRERARRQPEQAAPSTLTGPSRPRPVSTPAPAPPPARPEPVTIEELAAAVSFDERSEPVDNQPSKPLSQRLSADVDETSPPKTSAEMVEEARRRYAKDR